MASIGAGCLIAALLLVAAIAAFLFFALRGSEVGIARRAFPSGVEIGNALHQESQSGGREGCALVIFRLGDEAVRALEENSTAYLEGLGDKTGSDRMLSGWRETPMLDGRQGPIPLTDEVNQIPADAAWNCNRNRPAERVRSAYAAAARPGSYYATYNRGEGAIMLIPSERIAVFLYYG